MELNREEELLVVLQEECGELVQAIAKLNRFGKTDLNMKNIESEMGDVFALCKILMEEGYINPEAIMKAGDRKIEKLKKYMKNPAPDAD